MQSGGRDEIADFYSRHPYPPPVGDLDDTGGHGPPSGDGSRISGCGRIVPAREDRTILIAGCGTSQAAKYAVRYPEARVVGIDVSSTSIDETRRLAVQHGLDHLELHRLPIEQVGELGETFDQIVSTGVLHHLADPVVGLTALTAVLGRWRSARCDALRAVRKNGRLHDPGVLPTARGAARTERRSRN